MIDARNMGKIILIFFQILLLNYEPNLFLIYFNFVEDSVFKKALVNCLD